VNGVLAQHALALLARLFRDGQLSHHGGFVDVATSRAVPLAVDPLLWRQVRKSWAANRQRAVPVCTHVVGFRNKGRRTNQLRVAPLSPNTTRVVRSTPRGESNSHA
jgi:hypothetical protein